LLQDSATAAHIIPLLIMSRGGGELELAGVNVLSWSLLTRDELLGTLVIICPPRRGAGTPFRLAGGLALKQTGLVPLDHAAQRVTPLRDTTEKPTI
jgi:hypothetical protein